MNKKLLSLLLVTLIIFTMGTTAFAAPVTPTESNSPRADEIIAYYRNNADGYLEMRRWNATRGYWIEDWFIVGSPTDTVNWLVVEIDGTDVLLAPN